MRLDVDGHVQIARRAAARPACPCPATRSRAPSATPAGTGTATVSARVSDRPGRHRPRTTPAAAVRCHRSAGTLARTPCVRAPNAARRCPRSARSAIRPRDASPCRAHASAPRLPRHRDRPLAAAQRLLERQHETSRAGRRRARAPCAAAPRVNTSANRSPKVAAWSVRTRDREIEALERRRRCAARAAGSSADAVVPPPAIGIDQRLVGLGDLRNRTAATRSPGLMSGWNRRASRR